MKTHFKHPTSALLAGIAILCLGNLFFGLGRLPFLGPDEPRYAQVAREMLSTGDWIIPRLAGIPWLEKPSLLYWMAGLGYAVFGVSEFAARFGVALIAAAAAFLLYKFGSSMRSPRFGFVAAVVLLTMGVWIGFARGATFDMPLTVAMQLALLSFFWWEQAEGPDTKSNGGWYLCCFALGLAVLAKGLVGVVLPGAIVGLYLSITGRLGFLLKKPLALVIGASVLLLTAATWYGPMFVRLGSLFFNEFFVAHHFQRYLSDRYRHPQPFYFFPLVALAGCFPWTAYLGAAAFRDGRGLRQLISNKDSRLRLFLWLWVLVPVIFFSFSGSKLPGYVLPVFPPIALLIALEIYDGPRRTWPVVVTGVMMLLCAVAMWLVGQQELGLGIGVRSIVGLLGTGVAVASVVIGLRRGPEWAAGTLGCGVMLIVVSAVFLISPGLARRESIRDIATVATSNARHGEKMIFYLDNDQGINFYAPDLPLRDAKSELITMQHGDEIATLLNARGFESILVMCFERWSGGLVINDKFTTERLATHSREVGCSPGCDWVLMRVTRGGKREAFSGGETIGK